MISVLELNEIFSKRWRMVDVVGTTTFAWFAIFVALNTLLLLVLGLNISRLRISQKIPYGDGDYRPMMQAIRAHGNGVEHTTIYGMAILAMTLMQVDSGWVATMVLTFTGARMLHAYGMLYKAFTARRIGAGITFLLQGISVVVLFSVV